MFSQPNAIPKHTHTINWAIDIVRHGYWLIQSKSHMPNGMTCKDTETGNFVLIRKADKTIITSLSRIK
jgi:hypothetical protein